MNRQVLLTSKQLTHLQYTLGLPETWTRHTSVVRVTWKSVFVKDIRIHRRSFDRSHSRITRGSGCAAQPQPTSGLNSAALT
eukprot:1014505-Amphidinium_carterae.2